MGTQEKMLLCIGTKVRSVQGRWTRDQSTVELETMVSGATVRTRMCIRSNITIRKEGMCMILFIFLAAGVSRITTHTLILYMHCKHKLLVRYEIDQRTTISPKRTHYVTVSPPEGAALNFTSVGTFWLDGGILTFLDPYISLDRPYVLAHRPTEQVPLRVIHVYLYRCIYYYYPLHHNLDTIPNLCIYQIACMTVL